MSLYFECAGLSYKLQGQVPPYITEDIKHYLTEEKTPGNLEITCTLKYVSDFEPVAGIPVFQNPFRLILDNNGKECRIHLHQGNPVAYYKESSDSEVEIFFSNQLPPIMDMPFLEHFALERHLLKLDGYVIHACVIEHEGAAIVFTAPSGTGKSTQGDLWVKYKGAKIINGDKCIIQKRGDQFFACGLPFCGSSTINENKTLPLKAIVTLSQAPSDTLEVLETRKAFKKIMSETSINYWNSKFVEHMITLITETANHVPVVHLACTPTQEAVNILSDFFDSPK